MKTVIPIVTGCAILFVSGAFSPNRQASGQVSPLPESSWNPYATTSGGAMPHDPEMQNLFKEEHKAAEEASKFMREYAAADNEEKRAKIKIKVAEALGKQFDSQQKRRDLELVRLEAQMKRVRELMKKRTDARTTIIEKRLDQLVREADGLGWAPPQGPNLRNFQPNTRFEANGFTPPPARCAASRTTSNQVKSACGRVVKPYAYPAAEWVVG